MQSNFVDVPNAIPLCQTTTVCMTLLVQTVKTVDSSENNTKAIDSWIKSIADLHRTQPAPTVHYSKYVLLLITDHLCFNSWFFRLWHCWLGVRKSIRPIKVECWGVGVVICLVQSANDLHMVQLLPLPPHHLLVHWSPECFCLYDAGVAAHSYPLRQLPRGKN